MSTSKSLRTVYPSYALRLVQEVALQKWLLKPPTCEDRSLRKAAWSKIAAKLNAEFNADFTIPELQRKIEHVKAKAHKKQVQRCKISGEKPPATQVLLDFSSDDDTVSDTPIQLEDDAFDSSKSMHEKSDKIIHQSSSNQLKEEASMKKTESPRVAPSDVDTVGGQQRDVEHGNEIAKQSQVTITEHLPDMHDEEPQSKKARIFSSSSHGDSVSSSVEHSGTTETIDKAVDTQVINSTPNDIHSEWVADFKAKLVERLNGVPTEQIAEVHRMIRNEIDSLYAEQIAKDIQTRFKDEDQVTVKERVLSIVTG